jgi:GNAT superfamily N-acetyltransferase
MNLGGALALRLAKAHEVETVATLWEESAAWLKNRGVDQWQYPVRTAAIASAIDDETVWLLDDDIGPVATVTLDTDADEMLWLPADEPQNALYLHRLVVARRAAGQTLGDRILDWAGAEAARRGRRWLRLDAWTSNTGLHDYYLERGFELVRLVTAVRSGAAFQRPVVSP